MDKFLHYLHFALNDAQRWADAFHSSHMESHHRDMDYGYEVLLQFDQVEQALALLAFSVEVLTLGAF